jgi:GTP-binding protein EngB required for normal cell division
MNIVTRANTHATNITQPTLSAAHQLHLRVSCEYIDKMLQRIEAVLHTQQSSSPFSRYQLDFSPAQARVLEDYIRRLRAQLLSTLAWQRIQPPPPNIPATRSIATDLHFIEIALSELRPHAMRGSGELSPTAAAELTGVLSELSSITTQMMRYVKHELNESLHQRIQKLATGDRAPFLLQRIEQVITAQGLVEFRPRIDILLARLEDPTFEVAVFGRVSSGKSSFLNALLGIDALPVGANPITSVPTRVQHGPTVAASIRFGNRDLTDVTLDRFRALISEAGNPGNREGVRQAVLKTPSPRLAAGIVLVDTPGLGSLATQGTRETLAYLPSCDLALLLIDAAATLTLEDIGTLRLLHEAAIPSLGLLSKADLLPEPDRLASIEYIRSQIQDQLRLSIPVHPISSLCTFSSMLDSFYEHELQPRFLHSHTLRLQSVNTKLIRLQTDVITALEAKLQQLDSTQPADAASTDSLNKLLVDAAGRIATLARTTEDRILHLGFTAPQLIDRIVEQRITALRSGAALSTPFAELSRTLESLVQSEVSATVELLQTTVLQAVSELQQVGHALHRSSLPDENEIAALIRDAPRFELPTLPASLEPASLEPGYSRFFGTHAMRTRFLRTLRSTLQPTLHKELIAYSATLGIWAKALIRDIRFSLDSFAEAYRTSLQQRTQPPTPLEDTAEIRNAITALTTED